MGFGIWMLGVPACAPSRRRSRRFGGAGAAVATAASAWRRPAPRALYLTIPVLHEFSGLDSCLAALAHGRQDEEDSLSKVSQSFREYSQGQGWIALSVALLLLTVVLSAVLYSIASSRRSSAPWRAFREFAEASGLSFAETKLLTSVAERVQPDNPAALFVKRTLFESAVQELSIDAERAAILRQKVYGP